MRFLLACALLVALAACGGAQKHHDDEFKELDQPGGGSAPDMAAPPADTSAAKPASSSAAAPAAPMHPTPAANGTIDGKPFQPKLAVVAGPLQKDGRLLIALQEATDCVTSADAKPGDQTMTMTVPWKDGMKADLAAMKLPSKKGFGEIALMRVTADKKTDISTTFKPQGVVTILSAPMEQNKFGKMKIDLVSGDYMLAGEIDVKVCFPPK